MRRRRRHEGLLAGYDGPEAERVREAIVALADDESELPGLLAAARKDYRDVLWWEEQRRTGHREPPMSEKRHAELLASAGRQPPTSVPGPTADVVLLDAGARSPELLKAIRAATGLGLADVASLVDRSPPVRLVAGLERAQAERLVAELRAAGGSAELR